MLAWSIHKDQVIAIPKAGTRKHVAENAEAGRIKLSADDLWRLDEAFPQPGWKVPLDMI